MIKKGYKKKCQKRQKVSIIAYEDGRRILEQAAVRQPVLAFYSSVLGGMTMERALMTVPIDDHMVHRGHAV
jgi:4-amino-4-deoxychorismate lyase